MEEAIPVVEEAAPDVFGIKKLETPKTSRAMAPREFSTALPLATKNWPPRAVRRTQSVVGLKGIKRSQHQDRRGVSWHYGLCRKKI